MFDDAWSFWGDDDDEKVMDATIVGELEVPSPPARFPVTLANLLPVVVGAAQLHKELKEVADGLTGLDSRCLQDDLKRVAGTAELRYSHPLDLLGLAIEPRAATDVIGFCGPPDLADFIWAGLAALRRIRTDEHRFRRPPDPRKGVWRLGFGTGLGDGMEIRGF